MNLVVFHFCLLVAEGHPNTQQFKKMTLPDRARSGAHIEIIGQYGVSEGHTTRQRPVSVLNRLFKSTG
jgi:hypothetical protein